MILTYNTLLVMLLWSLMNRTSFWYCI